MLHIIAGCYKPNIAATLRLLALVRGLTEAGADYQLVFVYPNESQSIVDVQSGIDNIKYLWEKHPIKNKYLKFLRSFWDVRSYVSKLPKGTPILLINSNDYLPVIIRYKKKVRLFVENTEHPEILKVFPSFLQSYYLKAITQVDGVFVISTALKGLYEQMGVKNVSLLNMVVDPERFADIQKSKNREKYIAYCGSATNKKDGVDILIKAFALFLEKNKDFKLYIIGKNPAFSDDQTNVNLMHSMGLDDSIVFTGEIPSEEIPQILIDADFLVLARPDSRQAQFGFPTKLGEYLLTGNPVVVTSVGDIPLFLKDGESAIVARPGDEKSFASKMLWVAEHPEEAKEIGLRGRKVALSEFNGIIEAKKIISKIEKREE
ncbi:MAG: glycosyltransferase [Prevotella sp.]|nr:glycosyltransferase [Prevotella sp.]